MNKVDFISMENGTAEEYAFLDKLENQYLEDLPSRLIEALKALDFSLSGYQVSRLEHSLQGATRAFLAEEDLEMVMAVLFHDIGDSLAPHSHSEMAAAILRHSSQRKSIGLLSIMVFFKCIIMRTTLAVIEMLERLLLIVLGMTIP